MPNLNKVLIMGNLTRDPEMKYLPKGTAIASFGVAINHTYMPQGSNEKREEVTFIDVEAFGRTAEVIGEHLRKGRPVYIEGRLKLDQWDDKTTGKKMSKLKVIAENFQFLGSKEGQETAPEPRPKPAPRPAPPKDADLDVAPDDVPF